MPSFESASCGRGRANHTVMILLVTSSAKAQACAEAIQRATTETAQITTTFRRAATMLRAQEYSAVVIDESLLEREPAESETVMQHIGMAVPIHINFAISGIDRVVRALRGPAPSQQRNRDIPAICRANLAQRIERDHDSAAPVLRNGASSGHSATRCRSQDSHRVSSGSGDAIPTRHRCMTGGNATIPPREAWTGIRQR